MGRTLLLLAWFLVLAPAAAAARGDLTPRIPFDARSIGAAECTPSGSGARQVVDVSFHLTNYADAGYAAQWAIDRVNRHLRIWRHSDGTYCAQIDDGGSTFVTRAGPSPTGAVFIPSGITGTFRGGYITTDIVGKFRPAYPTHGDLGTFDTKCDLDFVCPGKHPSWLSYFTGATGDAFVHWGWLYDAGAHGTWLDQENVTPPFGGDIRG